MQTIKSFTPATIGALLASSPPHPFFPIVFQFMKVCLISIIQRHSHINNGWEQGISFFSCDDFTLPFLVLM
jgi:hypothetical protein